MDFKLLHSGSSLGYGGSPSTDPENYPEFAHIDSRKLSTTLKILREILVLPHNKLIQTGSTIRFSSPSSPGK